MSISYDNLWILLSQKGWKRVDLCSKAGITTNVLAKLGKNESVQIEILSKICGVFDCTFDDIVSNTGENKIIYPLPSFEFDSSDIFDYSIREEFETLGLKTIKDFKKPYTIKNIKKTLVKYIKEGLLSRYAVTALLEELKKHDIIIDIEENVIPEYDKIPKVFSDDDTESDVYKIEYQQVNNYVNWHLSSKPYFIEALKAATNFQTPIKNNGLNEQESIHIVCTNDTINYETSFQNVNKDSIYPINLLCDIFGLNTNVYYCEYQHKSICQKIDEVLSTLTPKEKIIFRYIYQNHIEPDKLHIKLGFPDDEAIKSVINAKYIVRPLRKLRHPNRSKHIRELILTNIKSSVRFNDLVWRWSDEFFDETILKELSNIISFDYILSSYISQKTELNTVIVLLETIHKHKIELHLFNIDVFKNIFEITTQEADMNFLEEQIKKWSVLPPQKNKISIQDLDLSVRTYNCLNKSNILSLEEILKLTEDDFYNFTVKNLGKKSLDELLEKLEHLGYYLNKKGQFEFQGTELDSSFDILAFAKYYSMLYSRNFKEDEDLLKEKFIERCQSLGFSLNGADWFIDMMKNANQDLNDIGLIDKIDNNQLLGSLILKRWRWVTHWSDGNLLSPKNRIWFLVAFNRLYQIALNEDSEKINI